MNRLRWGFRCRLSWRICPRGLGLRRATHGRHDVGRWQMPEEDADVVPGVANGMARGRRVPRGEKRRQPGFEIP